jgi:hypothetical protein
MERKFDLRVVGRWRAAKHATHLRGCDDGIIL